LHQFERLAGLELDVVDLAGLEQEVLVVGKLVALEDILALHRADAGHRLLVTHGLARGPVDLAEADRAPDLVAAWISTGMDQGEAQLPLPDGARDAT
jgi:hypothetical protein